MRRFTAYIGLRQADVRRFTAYIGPRQADVRRFTAILVLETAVIARETRKNKVFKLFLVSFAVFSRGSRAKLFLIAADEKRHGDCRTPRRWREIDADRIPAERTRGGRQPAFLPRSRRRERRLRVASGGFLLLPARQDGLEMGWLIFAGDDADFDFLETSFFKPTMQIAFGEAEPAIAVEFVGFLEVVF